MSILELLADCESFISGFEDDETQEQSVNPLLARIRAAIAAPLPTLGIVISRGTLQAVIADHPETAVEVLNGIVLVDYDNGAQAEECDPDVFEIEQHPDLARHQTEPAQVVDVAIETPAIDFTGLLAQMDARTHAGAADGESSE